MLIPPGVEVLVNDCRGEPGGDAPSVVLKEILTLMVENGAIVAAILPMSEDHLIVVGYLTTVETSNAKTPPGIEPGGARKRRSDGRG